MLRRRRKYLGYYSSINEGWWYIWFEPMSDHHTTQFLVSRRRFFGRKLWGYWEGMIARFHEDDLREMTRKIQETTRGD